MTTSPGSWHGWGTPPNDGFTETPDHHNKSALAVAWHCPVDVSDDDWTRDVKKNFSGRIIVAKDLMQLPLPV